MKRKAVNLEESEEQSEDRSTRRFSYDVTDRKSLRNRADRGRGHGFEIRASYASKKHIKFDNDGNATDFAADSEQPPLGERLSNAQSLNSGAVDRSGSVQQSLMSSNLPGQSILERTPDSVMFLIFDHLQNPLSAFPDALRCPQDVKQYQELLESAFDSDALLAVVAKHPYFRLAKVSKAMYDIVEKYCAHRRTAIAEKAVQTYRERHKGKAFSESQKVRNKVNKRSEKDSSARNNWLKTQWCHCLFCCKSTARRAIFDGMAFCCRKCDNKLWPKADRNEILSKKSRAFSVIHLDKPHLILPEIRQPRCAYDGITKKTYYLLEDVDKIWFRLESEDPDRKKTRQAEEKLANGQETISLLPAFLQGENDPWNQ